MTTKRQEPIECKKWLINNVDIMTNVGLQTTDLQCTLYKHIMTRDSITLFERFVLGYKNYFYRINVIPKEPIRENRDKDYLPSFSKEGNDCTYEFSLGLGTNKDDPDLSEDGLNQKVLESLRDYDPTVKKNKYINRIEKWTNKTLFKKSFNNYNERFVLFTAIYPFTQHDLSGLTEVLSLRINNDNEDGIGLSLGLMGFHFNFHSLTIYKWISKTIVKRPKWDNGLPYDDFRKIYTKWSKDHPVRHFLDVDWNFDIGINRYYGFFCRSEIDGSSKGTYHLNPFRNRFWNLI